MTQAECIGYIAAYLTKVVNLFKSPPKGTTLFIAETNTKGFKFGTGAPMYFYNVATNTTEENTLKTGTAEFINVATYTRWVKNGSNWVGTSFSGQSHVLRKGTLLLAKNTGVVYLYASTGVFHVVDSTSEQA